MKLGQPLAIIKSSLNGTNSFIESLPLLITKTFMSLAWSSTDSGCGRKLRGEVKGPRQPQDISPYVHRRSHLQKTPVLIILFLLHLLPSAPSIVAAGLDTLAELRVGKHGRRPPLVQTIFQILKVQSMHVMIHQALIFLFGLSIREGKQSSSSH